jgi:hypothetical protein
VASARAVLIPNATCPAQILRSNRVSLLDDRIEQYESSRSPKTAEDAQLIRAKLVQPIAECLESSGVGKGPRSRGRETMNRNRDLFYRRECTRPAQPVKRLPSRQATASIDSETDDTERSMREYYIGNST